MKTFGFMHTNGDIEIVTFTNEQIKRGELKAHIEFMEQEGFVFMGEETEKEKQ